MDPEKYKRLRKFWPKIADNIDLAQLLPHLQCLLETDRQSLLRNLENEGNWKTVANHLPDCIRRRPDGYTELLKGMLAQGQAELVAEIDPSFQGVEQKLREERLRKFWPKIAEKIDLALLLPHLGGLLESDRQTLLRKLDSEGNWITIANHLPDCIRRTPDGYNELLQGMLAQDQAELVGEIDPSFPGGLLSPEAEQKLREEWQARVGDDYEIVVAQFSKSNKDGGLGFSLEGTVDVENGEEVWPHHFIRSVGWDGPAGINGKLTSGDELLEVNNTPLLGLNHVEVVEILKELPQHVRIVCARNIVLSANMPDSWKKDIARQFTKFSDNLNRLDDIIDSMYSEQLLSPNQKAEIEFKSPQRKQINFLMCEIVPRLNQSQFQCFKNILIKHEQHQLAIDLPGPMPGNVPTIAIPGGAEQPIKIKVSGIPKGTSTEYLKILFEGRVTGGGPLESIEMGANGQFVVIQYKDKLDAENLLARGTIPFQGVNLMINRVPKQDIFKHISHLSPIQINILVAHKYVQMDEGLDVDVTIDVDRCQVTFASKDMEALTKKKDDMNEFLRSIKSQTFHLPTSKCTLLKQEKTVKILNKEWRKRNLIIVTGHELTRHGRTAEETTALIELHARTEQEISDGVDILNNTVLEETVNVPGSSQAAMKSDAWKEVCGDLLHKCEGEVLIRVSEDLSSIHVTGIRHIMASVLATIKRFLEQKKVNTKRNIPLFHRGDATSWEWTEAEKRLLTETSGMRVLYIGEYMAGKTSLVRTILSDGSFMSDKDDRTIVAEMNHWVPDPKKKNTFSLVDLGGHESYISSGHFFHCNAKNNVATLCHDIRSNKFSKSFKWLKAVLTRSPVCHIVLALTKSDTLSEREKNEALETFKSVLTRYLEKEIRTLEATILMAKKNSDKLPTFMKLTEHYQWLVANLNDITFLVSCKEGYEDTVLKVKEHYITLSEKPENKVLMPVHYHSFFCVSGKSGMRIVQQREETYEAFDTGNERSPAESPHYDASKPESKSDVAAEAPRTAKAEDVELNKAKQPKKITQFLKLEEAIQQFDKILEEHQLPTDDLPGQMKRCLESLHQHGLMLYFACGELENIVFNNLNTFISIMRAIFYHDIKHFHDFDKLPIAYKVGFYNNEESSFNEDLDLLLTQGLLSAHLLTIFLDKSECEIEAKAVMKLFDVLEIGFSFIPDNLETVHTFIPFFVENRKPPDEVCDKIDRMAKCEEDFLSLHCQVRGNITVTLWHYLLVRFCKTLHSSMQRKVIWDGGFLASVGQSKINILMLFNGEDKIDMIIKGQLKSTRSHDLLWYYIGIFNDEIGRLTTDWWPGLITKKLLFCTHCKISCCENVHEWSLDENLKCKDETCGCPSELCDIASGLIAPLPIDATEAEQRLSEVKLHLKKTCQSHDTQMAVLQNTQVQIQNLELSTQIKEIKEEVIRHVSHQTAQQTSILSRQNRVLSDQMYVQGKFHAEQAHQHKLEIIEQADENKVELTEQADQNKVELTEQAEQNKTKITEQADQNKSQLTQQADKNKHEIGNKVALDAGDASALETDYIHPVLQTNKGLLEQRLCVTVDLLSKLFVQGLLWKDEMLKIQRQEGESGQRKLLLLFVDTNLDSDSGLHFDQFIQSCKYSDSPANVALVKRMNFGYSDSAANTALEESIKMVEQYQKNSANKDDKLGDNTSVQNAQSVVMIHPVPKEHIFIYSYIQTQSPSTAILRDKGGNKHKQTIRNRLVGANRRISCKDLGHGDCQGWLYIKKESHSIGRNFVKCWCVLKDNNLYYYKTPDDQKAHGVVHLPGFQVSPANEFKTKKFAFAAHHSGTAFFFASDRQEDRAKWMNKMGLAAIAYDAKNDPTTASFISPRDLSTVIENGSGYYSESDDDESIATSLPSTPSLLSKKSSKEDLTASSLSIDDLEKIAKNITRNNMSLEGQDRNEKRRRHLTSNYELLNIDNVEEVEKKKKLKSLERTLKEKQLLAHVQHLEAIEADMLEREATFTPISQERDAYEKILKSRGESPEAVLREISTNLGSVNQKCIMNLENTPSMKMELNRDKLISNQLGRRSKSLPNILSTPMTNETNKMAKPRSCIDICMNKVAPFQSLSYKVNADCNGGIYCMPNIHSDFYIPQGALMNEDGETLEIEIIQLERQDTVPQHTQYQSASHVYELLPHELEFKKPVMFKFPLLLHHIFNIKGLKLLYSPTTGNEVDKWIELPIRSTDQNHENGFGWFIWEQYCYVTMKHFCKIHMVVTDDAESTKAVFVKTLLFANYLEQKQLVELRVLFTCAEDDSKHQNKIKSLGNPAYEKCVLFYENGGDLQLSLKLANPGEWRIPEELASQILDKNYFFLTPLCQLSLPIEHIFNLQSEGSAHLNAQLYIQQRKQNHALLPPFTLNLDINNIQRNKSQQQLLEEATLKHQMEKEDILKQNADILKQNEVDKNKVKELEQQNKVLAEQLEHFTAEKYKLPSSNTPIKEGEKEDDKNKKQQFLEEATLKHQMEKEDILKQNQVDKNKVKELEQQNKVLAEQLEQFTAEKYKLPSSNTPIKEGEKEEDKNKKISESRTNYPITKQRQETTGSLPQPRKAKKENEASRDNHPTHVQRQKNKSCIPQLIQTQPNREYNDRTWGMHPANPYEMPTCSSMDLATSKETSHEFPSWLMQSNVKSTTGHTHNVLIQHYHYGEMLKQNQQTSAIENDIWPAGFDNEFRKYLFSLIVVLDDNRDKFHEIAKSVGIARENGFNAQTFLSAWYLNKVNNNSVNGDCHDMWIELLSVFRNGNFMEAENELTVAIEKKKVQTDIVYFNDHLCDFKFIVTKLFGCGTLDKKQFMEFEKDNDVTKLITEVILQADKKGFYAFKDALRVNRQSANIMLLHRISLGEE